MIIKFRSHSVRKAKRTAFCKGTSFFIFVQYGIFSVYALSRFCEKPLRMELSVVDSKFVPFYKNGTDLLYNSPFVW
ncbi:MAG TPA: hypothetical protein DIW30_06815 [Bacteroidales bacterium]|nr:hypothetical protein [Bacteroidales bacterium]